MLEISRKLFSTFNKENVEYCSWKGNDHIEQCLSGIGDIDVLVSRNSKANCRRILNELHFLHCKSQFGCQIPDVEDWLGFDESTGKMIHLHLHFEMVAGIAGLMEYNLPWGNSALSTRILDKNTGVYMIKPELELLTRYVLLSLSANIVTSIKYSFKGYHIPKKYLPELEYLMSKSDIGIFRGLVSDHIKYNPTTFADIVEKNEISDKDYSTIRSICKISLKKDCRYNPISRFFKSGWLILTTYIRAILKKIPSCTVISKKTPFSGVAPIITFMGQDGAGKSTVVKDIRKWLEWKLEVNQFYLGSGDHYQPWEKKMANRLHGSNNPVAKLIRKWLPFNYLSKLGKNVYDTIVKANKYSQRGGIVLFDRYPQTMYEGINDGPKIRATIMQHANNKILHSIASYYANKEEKYLRKAVAYAPDVVIKLMLSPEESIRRKPHENYEAVKIKHEIIKSLKFENAAVYTIDATQDYDKEIIEIKNIIWKHILKS